MTRWLVFASNRLSEWRAIILAMLQILQNTISTPSFCREPVKIPNAWGLRRQDNLYHLEREGDKTWRLFPIIS
ncbi:uncharacterized protein BKA55DRAFT_562597 [Fusarium redolens]|uniref:Uncharacterized protein n=1 Tax=Fusarium redolens TaxID=48865 RepID=A0A9P9HKW0_FUSRE|nr:uncharacterized protein BKA55DRAFT_562597 [Fusarium redolens]KAH7259474.1 hypothetical protein BKA55DRAFT_562597 [Fusarium redolens]